MSNRRVVGFAVIALLPLLMAPAQTQQTMRTVLDALLSITPTLVDPETFESADNRDRIERSLRALADAAAYVDRHGMGFDPSYDRVRRNFAEDTADGLRSFLDGEFETSRFLLRHVTEDCFDCHSRLPSADRDDLAESFAGAVDVSLLPLSERMRLLVATRQFEAARGYAEALLNDDAVAPVAIDGAGTFQDYLKVCLRVGRDFDRPRAALRRFLDRQDLPVYLRLQVTDWEESLGRLQSMDTSDRLAAAEELLREAGERNLYLQDRRGLVHATLASGLLHEYVLTAPPGPGATARAYYLLGLAESTISRSDWVPETEYYLELAIRSAPGTDTARAAYAVLEQFVIAAYTGSAGTDLPDDVRLRLQDLRDLAFR